ncbi:MAG: helix-turn-helix transcriptional regulator [Myxococcales bacterium]|nr:helix-turn-helix transcriptional regulator [Myxococcales bacterium]
MPPPLDHHDRTRRKGAELLARWQRRAKLSQQDAATRVGLSPQEYNRITRGVEVPGMIRATRIAARTDGAVPVGSWVEPAVRA